MRYAWAGLLLAAAVSCGAAAQPPVRDGDIVFHTSRSQQSVAIQRATKSPYSHMGLVIFRKGEPYVLEGSATVRYTPLSAWLARGTGGHYVVKRLRRREPLSAQDVGAIKREGARFVGKQYDLAFGWADDRIYCSELVWKIYDRALAVQLAPLAELGSFDLSSAEVKAKLLERYGATVPLHEPVVAPSAISESSLLETVAMR